MAEKKKKKKKKKKRRFKKKKKKKKNVQHRQNGVIIFTCGTEIFCMLFSFQIFSALKSSYLKVKVRTGFSNVWGEYKNHSNPYIQGTTVPCDIIYIYTRPPPAPAPAPRAMGQWSGISDIRIADSRARSRE